MHVCVCMCMHTYVLAEMQDMYSEKSWKVKLCVVTAKVLTKNMLQYTT